MADIGQLPPSEIQQFHDFFLQIKKPSLPVWGTRTEDQFCGTTLLTGNSGHLSNGANTPFALNAGITSSDTRGECPFPPALGGPFAAPLFAPISASGTLCGCADSFTSASLVWCNIWLQSFNHASVRLSRTIFRTGRNVLRNLRSYDKI